MDIHNESFRSENDWLNPLTDSFILSSTAQVPGGILYHFQFFSEKFDPFELPIDLKLNVFFCFQLLGTAELP